MANTQSFLITIDGPAASGKSSVSRAVAKKLGWNWVSTGAFYRGLAYVALHEKLRTDDIQGLVALCGSSLWHVEMSDAETRVIYRGQDVTRQIQDENIGSYASKVSPHPDVRNALLGPQRACLHGGSGLVAEGRDCGTVVFPFAPLKIFLTAGGEERAQRRAQEHGKSVAEILQAQEKRDFQDRHRTTAPLQVAQGGVLIDSSQLDFVSVVAHVLEQALKTFPELGHIS